MGQIQLCKAKPYSLCGSRAFVNEMSNYKTWLLANGIFVIVIISFMLRFIVRWINFKDYFPLKQRSPILCLVLLLFLTIQLVLYPTQILVNYFLTGQQTSAIFRVAYSAIKTMGAFIYILRTLRINYAYRLRDNMRSHWIFRLFKNQNSLVGIVLLLACLRVIPPVLCPRAYPSPVALGSQNGSIFFVRALIEDMVWHLFLISCLWTQRDMRMEFGLVPEIGTILAVSLMKTAAQITTSFVYRSQDVPFDNVVANFQCYELEWPINQYLVMLTSLVMMVASIAYPLTKLRREHELLPIQQVYDLENNLRAFLLEPMYFKLFYSFLKNLEQSPHSEAELKLNTGYITLINCWAKITRFKLQESTDSAELIVFFRNLDTSIFPKSVINQLYQSSQMLNQNLEISERDKVRSSINMALEQLEDQIIGQLSVVYKNRFRRTRAYIFLKKAMQQNDRINTNLLMLNMILREHSQI